MIIVGENFSSNARRLAEVAAETCVAVQLVASREDLDWSMIPVDGIVAVSAAASTPESSVLDVVDSLRERFDVHMEERGSIVERALFRPLALS